MPLRTRTVPKPAALPAIAGGGRATAAPALRLGAGDGGADTDVAKAGSDAQKPAGGGWPAWLGRGLSWRRTPPPASTDPASTDVDLKLNEARMAAALAHIGQGLSMYDRHERLVVANPRYCELYGLAPGDVRPGTTFRNLIARCQAAGCFSSLDLDELYASRVRNIQARAAAITVEEPRPGVFLRIHIAPLADGGWIATLDDITAHRQAEQKVAHLARHDALTGLPNRVLLRERLEQELAKASRGGPFGVMLLDLDRFKAVNDLMGQPAGDRLLQLAGERMQACVREVDLVARLGGDEFAIVVSEAALPDGAGRVAERIIAAFATPFELEAPKETGDAAERRRVATGISIGIAIAPGDGANPDALLRHADMALHRAKAEHRGTARFFEPGMDASHLARRQAEQDLRLALEREEFCIFYQPLVSLHSGEVVAFEALLRWRHPERGLVPPADFIPLAEETGLIVPIGAWVLQTACREAAGWAAPAGVAVNLSAVQFRSPNLAGTVSAALAGSGLPPARLELEITESVLLHDNAGTLATLHGLRGLGVRIAMDDFGTGYSSLSYLHSFPFDKIKIDRMFVRDLLDRASSGAIVRAIAGLGASLGIATTAEGVETSEQMARLRRDGCTEAQGYLISRPVPASDVPGLMAQGSRLALTA